MKVRKLDSVGDMNFGNGDYDFYKDTPETVAQIVLTTLKLWQGEWFLDDTLGVPYSQAILGVGKQQTAEMAMRTAILGVDGVKSLDYFEMSVATETRTIKFNATITTIYGQTQIEGVL